MTLVTFIIPVRHPDNARDWAALTEKLSQTARSVANQSHPDWRGIVVANEGAQIPDLPENFSVTRVTFPPNDLHELGKGPKHAVLDAFRIDKGRRVLAGMLSARDSRYFMIVDDDDLVSGRLVAHVAADPEANGWVVRKGYLWDDGGPFLLGVNDFNERCGSCLIVRSDLYGLPESLEAADPEWIKTMLGSHRRIDAILAEGGHPLTELPFRGSVYRVANAGSHSHTPGILRQALFTRSNIKCPHRFLINLARMRRVKGALGREFFGRQG